MDRKFDESAEDKRQPDSSSDCHESKCEVQPNLSVFDDIEISQEVGISPTGFSKRTVKTTRERENRDLHQLSSKGAREADLPRQTKLGIVAIIASILSFFFLSVILAPTGIVLGIFALQKDDRRGWYAIAIGSVVLILIVLIFPMVYRRH